jgi:hypothetical protein
MPEAVGPARVVPLRTHLRVLAPVRAGLGVLALLGALAAGARFWAALLAFVVGAVAGGAFLTGDRRGVRRRLEAPPPLPAASVVEGSWLRVAAAGVVPSTAAVSALAAAAFAFEPTLAASLAGVLAGMALATCVSWADLAARERHLGGTLLVERNGSRLFLARGDARHDAG